MIEVAMLSCRRMREAPERYFPTQSTQVVFVAVVHIHYHNDTYTQTYYYQGSATMDAQFSMM